MPDLDAGIVVNGSLYLFSKIERNKINILRTMRKSYCRKLRDFGIAGNSILDCSEMTQFQGTAFRMFGLETRGLKEQSPDIRWLGKLETNNLTHVCTKIIILDFRSPQRILKST